MANTNVDGQENSGFFQMFLAFGGALFRFLKKIGVVRTGGMIDTWDDERIPVQRLDGTHRPSFGHRLI